jgi:polygalacturonase
MIVPSRRRFLFGAAALLAAPAIAKASNLMPISVLKPPKLWGDGIHDDTAAIQHFIDTEMKRAGERGDGMVQFPAGTFRLTDGLRFNLQADTFILGSGSSFVYDFPANRRDQAVIQVDGNGHRVNVRHIQVQNRNVVAGGRFFAMNILTDDIKIMRP